jgi:hypothetical protein
MPVGTVKDELENLRISVQGILQLRSDLLSRKLAKLGL